MQLTAAHTKRLRIKAPALSANIDATQTKPAIEGGLFNAVLYQLNDLANRLTRCSAEPRKLPAPRGVSNLLAPVSATRGPDATPRVAERQAKPVPTSDAPALAESGEGSAGPGGV